jgi:hypothetical protein
MLKLFTVTVAVAALTFGLSPATGVKNLGLEFIYAEAPWSKLMGVTPDTALIAIVTILGTCSLIGGAWALDTMRGPKA